MKKTVRLLLTMSLILCMLLALPFGANAAVTEVKDGLEVTILTDGNKYDAGEEILVTLKIKNDNDFKVEGISAEILLPEGLSLSDGETAETLSIKPGETAEYSVVAKATDAGGLDMIWIIAIAAGAVVLAVVVILIVVLARKKKKKVATAALSLLLCLSMLPFGAFAEEKEGEKLSISVFKTITVGKNKHTVKANVQYKEFTAHGGSNTDPKTVPPEIAELYGVDPNDYDTDKDGLSNYTEIYETLTDPKKEDTDENGVKDGDEDADGDGLTNLQEIKLGTDPSATDTDNDNLDDKAENSEYKTSPCVYDTDADGVSDGDEIVLGLDPLKQKSDGLTLDSQREFTQVLAAENISESLIAEDSAAIPSLTLTSSQAIDNHVSISMADTDAFGDSRAVVGSPIEITGEKIDEGTISFALQSAAAAYATETAYNTKLICKYNTDGSTDYLDTTYDAEGNTVSASVEGEGTYFVLDLKNLFDELGLSMPTVSDARALAESTFGSSSVSGKITRAPHGAMAQADIVFIIDTTGSMDDEINNVKNNVQSFVDVLKEKGVSAGLALIDYQDITVDGYDSTKVHKNGTSNWFYDMEDYKTAISGLTLGNGGDWPECAVDALETGRLLDMRPSAGKIFILVTDADYKVDNRYDIPSMSVEIELLKNAGVTCAVVCPSSEQDTYFDLYNETNGVWANINGDFYSVLMGLADKIGTDIVGDGHWVYLDGPVPMPVRLEEEPTAGSTVDTDGDGIYDIQELEGINPTGKIDLDALLTKASQGVITGTEYGVVLMYKYKTNPALSDTDYDGILDFEDTRPTIWDISDRDLAMFAQICYEDIPAGTRLDTLALTHPTFADSIKSSFKGAATLEELKGWKVLKTHYSMGGLQIAVFEKDRQMVFACRGSEDKSIWYKSAEFWKDWVVADGLGWITGINAQAPAAKSFVKKVMKLYPSYDVYVTGHSLGGNVAYNLASKALDVDAGRVKKINTYNGLGLLFGITLGVTDLVDEYRLKKHNKIITDYKIDGDPVYPLSIFHYGTCVELALCDAAYGAHDLYSFLEHLPRYHDADDGGSGGGGGRPF